MLATVPKGREFVVVAPVFRDYRAWRARWTKLVWRKSQAWSWILQRDPRVKRIAHIVTDEIAAKQNYFKPIQAFVYRRVGYSRLRPRGAWRTRSLRPRSCSAAALQA